MPIASWPLLADTTRYPLVANMNLSTESSCSLSSTQRMIFFGRMIFLKHSSVQFVGSAPLKTRLRGRSSGGLRDRYSKAGSRKEGSLKTRLFRPVC
jgi:hypothetical protein